MMTHNETDTQIAILQYLQLVHPAAYKCVIKIDNEGNRSKAGHAIAKKAGLHKYASDLFIAYPTLNHYGLFMEIKPDDWRGSRGKAEKTRVEGQKQFLEERKNHGYQGEFVVGIDEGILALKRYFNL